MLRRLVSATVISATLTGVATAQEIRPMTHQQLVMTRFTVRDVERNGRQPLVQLLVPQGWKSESSVQWTLASCYAPVQMWQRYSAPDGSASVEFLPTVQGALNISPFGTTGHAPPRDVLEALANYAASQRPGARFRISDRKAMPWQQTAISAHGSMHTHAGSLVIAYEENGREVEEEFAGKLVVIPTATEGFESRMWFIQEVRAIKAPRGKLDEYRAIGIAMNRSARATPEFEKAFEVAGRLIVDLQRKIIDIQRAEREMILQTNREINDLWRKTCDERWVTRDRQQEQFRDVLGGVNRFVSTTGGEVLLPLSHKYAWENKDKEVYILSNDPSYRPDADFSGTWSELKAKN